MANQRRKLGKKAAPRQYVSLTLTTQLLREVDALAKRVERPRSQIIAMACRKYVTEMAEATPEDIAA